MSMKLCPIQHVCPADKFDAGNHRGSKYPANQHVRETMPCKYFLDLSCEESIRIQIFLGETMTCPIDIDEKIERVKKKPGEKK